MRMGVQKEKKCKLGHVQFEVLVRHSRGDLGLEAGCVHLEPRRRSWKDTQRIVNVFEVIKRG